MKPNIRRPFPNVCFLLLFLGLPGTSSAAEQPTISSASVNATADGTLTISVFGAGFGADAKLLVDGVETPGVRLSTSQIRATTRAKAGMGGLFGLKVSSSGSVSKPYLVESNTGTQRVTYRAAVRFLEQSSFGPTPASVARVQAAGFDTFLEEQFRLRTTRYAASKDQRQTLAPVQDVFFNNVLRNDDQLRQRVAFALSQIFVVSGYKTFSPEQVIPYVQLLHDNAFANYYDLLRAVTLSPTMGRYLDMVNSSKQTPTNNAGPNENFARELLQLFTIGTEKLNLDGSTVRDGMGQAVPTYSQQTVAAFARAFTGWDFASGPSSVDHLVNAPYYNAPMVVSELLHDTGSKELLNGTVLPAGQNTEQDLNAALDNIFRHPNVGPFLAIRLIRSLVTSNPSAAYVRRVASVFNANSSGARGDLKAVIKAILLDPEARAGDTQPAAPTSGHLREPILHMTTALRGMEASSLPGQVLSGYGMHMDQFLFYAPSVFSYFSPTHVIPSNRLFGPEFQIFHPASAVARINFGYALTMGASKIGVELNLAKLEALDGDVDALVRVAGRVYLRDAMPEGLKRILVTAMEAVPARLPKLRAQTALYLTLSSPLYAVQQ